MQHELTAGLEVHQQLDTGKLFCNCPSSIRDDIPDFTVRRVLRAAAGEGGETDLAAQLEQHKEKMYHYQGYEDITCLVELDEEPVSTLNSDALRTSLQVARLLNLEIVDEIHVMRKTVVDGSNTSGFQRTALIGLNGAIQVDENKIRIEQLCLEEDSCKIIERTATHDTYNLSRLGIPLLEITTGPDMHTPAQVKAVAAYLGMLLRSTERVKRGIGTIRQDVNVSVPGGARVEIKGAQELDMLAKLVENEAQRQRALINLAKIIPRQHYEPRDITDALKGTSAGFIAKALQAGSAIGVRLANWQEAMDAELEPGIRLGKELAGYAKAHGFGGLIHSAEQLSKYPLSEQEQKSIRELLQCAADDSWLFMLGDRARLLRFFDSVLLPRLAQLSLGVPAEVRKAEADGTTSYLRPMPGAARMYPETDVRPTQPELSGIALPELLFEQEKRISQQYDISAELAKQLTREGLAGTFEQWAKKYSKVSASIIATLLASKEQEIRTRHNLAIDIRAFGEEVLVRLNAGELTLQAVEDVLVKLAKHEPLDWKNYRPVSDEEVRRTVLQLVKENPGATQGLLMGKIMRHFENKVDGKLVMMLVAEALAKNE